MVCYKKKCYKNKFKNVIFTNPLKKKPKKQTKAEEKNTRLKILYYFKFFCKNKKIKKFKSGLFFVFLYFFTNFYILIYERDSNCSQCTLVLFTCKTFFFL